MWIFVVYLLNAGAQFSPAFASMRECEMIRAAVEVSHDFNGRKVDHTTVCQRIR